MQQYLIQDDLTKNEYILCVNAKKRGIIDFTAMAAAEKMVNRKEILEQIHPYKIWYGANNKWNTYLPDKDNKRKPIRRTKREDLEDIVVDYWKQETENPTINEVFQEWSDRRLRLKKISESTYSRNGYCFRRHYKEFGKRRIKSVSSRDVEEFLEEQIAEHDLDAKGFANLKGITKGFLKRAVQRDLISFSVRDLFENLDVSDRDFKKKVRDDSEEVFSEEEEEKIVNYLVENQDIYNLGILLLFVTGLRIGELAALKWECVGEDVLRIQRTETNYRGKDGHNVHAIKERPKTQAGVRNVVLPKECRWIIDELRKLNPSGEYVFMRRGKRMNSESFRKRLRKLCDALGIVRKTPHKIRKTYASILLDSGVDKRLILDQMGHTDITTTEGFYHRNRKNVQQKSAILSVALGFRADDSATARAS